MIKGFSKQTSSLEGLEYEILEFIAKKIKLNIGKDHAVTRTRIIQVVREAYNLDLSDARLRKMIKHIRDENLVYPAFLCASSQGYWVEHDPEKVKDYIIQSFRQRWLNQKATDDAMCDYFETVFGENIRYDSGK